MVEALPGVVPDEQRAVHRLLDQDRVRPGVTLLVEARGEDKPATDDEHRQDERERRGPDPPGPPVRGPAWRRPGPPGTGNRAPARPGCRRLSGRRLLPAHALTRR